MRLCLLLSFLMVLLGAQPVWAYSDVLVRKVFVTKDDSGNKKYLAWMDDDRFHPDDWVILFGYKNGKLKARSFDAGFFLFDKGDSITVKDAFYKMDLKVVSEKLDLKVKLESLQNPEDSRYKKTLKYKLTDSKKLSELAKKVAMTIWENFADQLEYTEVKDLDHLKKLLKLYERIGSNTSNGVDSIPFPVNSLQIESYFASTPANPKIAAIKKIDTRKGSDLISKTFRDSKKWTHPDYIPSGEDWEDTADESGEYAFFSYFNTGRNMEGFEDPLLIKAAKKYVKFEVVNVTGFECEDSYEEDKSFTWIFADGSSFSYSPGLECD